MCECQNLLVSVTIGGCGVARGREVRAEDGAKGRSDSEIVGEGGPGRRSVAGYKVEQRLSHQALW